ncbi:alanyl-tRNA synthetase [Bernardetia litoralis DSM 6794]|uniref:Alanine--tRNA ligase n=1 Tax=Bernardetia litoralis (strain ATCC 23117 / DSM 6794 / NBRC 15988 / NCIMB 1366 / Fx l1 / Sio-4) TaxID=880071 RepID=I4AGY5_BERLS|nr:alanine--tRNA ligase [Bernardetia litoralis]AFM03220.1 alanyl-tRNA synthetase [Bernardetia litoralis DSM 6794]
MTAKEVRQTFLNFFQEKQHLIVDSAPLIPKGDATLMFINSGMAQFKDYFLGNGIPPSTRITDTQKCLRVSGKHNDLDDVGIDTYHHTFFEMLGNWSFGDYFKQEALPWAWELLTEVYKLPKERLYVTVFEGNKEDNLPLDIESFEVWKQILGSEDRIIYGNKKDNFWEMGEVGPCGPSSEIHIDLRTDAERKKVDGKTLVNGDHPQVIEIWNNVFMEFERKANKSLVKLPSQHVDTGMGFERLVRAIEGKQSNYDTDVFTPLIKTVEAISGISYGVEEKTDIAIRVIADHIRAISFVIADGQLPSNNKQGYVVRRILRRAVRYGYTYLDLKEPFLFELVHILAEQFDDTFPELDAQKDFVARVVKEEENSFLRTLENGIKRFEEVKNRTKENLIDGQDVFELYDTFGFPDDLTDLMAREAGMKIDIEGFTKALNQQKKRSQKDASSEKSDWHEIQKDESVRVDFLGYDTLQAKAKIIRWREITKKGKTFYQIVLNQTPFYAESGGQVGDRGYIQNLDKNEDGKGEKISIIDTQKENDLIVHITKKLPSDFTANYQAIVSENLRCSTENNHSATHLLHAALREVLGTHVQQRGSLVSEDILRFDFSHFSKMTDEEIEKIETIVNQKIRENIELQEMRNTPIEEAKEMGAMALFGEKYGNSVRVVMFDKKYSVELCGGTHVSATGKIGFFKIISESSVASGVRRLEALTGEKAYNWIQEQNKLVKEIRSIVKGNKNLKDDVNSLVEQNAILSKQIQEFQEKEAKNIKKNLLTEVKNENGINILIQKIKIPSADALKNLSFELKNEVENLFAVLAADIEGKPQIAVTISPELVEERGLNAGKIIKDLAKNIKGGGGGQPFFATAGGKDLSGLDKVVEEAYEILYK